VLDFLTLAQLLASLRHALRWSAYGFFFGYFYTRLPGHEPVRKALCLFLAILPVELLLLLAPAASPAASLPLAVLLKAGEVAAFTMGLGLTWEWHLAHSADLPWSEVRDLRSISSLAAPVMTVIVAAATAVATVLAGAATTSLLHAPVSGNLRVQQEYGQNGIPRGK
jgi:hypothetical protein